MDFVGAMRIFNFLPTEKNMITSMIITIFCWLIDAVCFLLPQWQIWPDDLLNGIGYFCGCLAKLNFIFPIDTLFTVIIFVIIFESTYFSSKIVMKVINFFRGTGSGLDI